MSLPKGYTRLEYIQSGGTQYVDTEFTPNQNTSVRIKFATTQSGSYCILGCDAAWKSTGIGIWPANAEFGDNVAGASVFSVNTGDATDAFFDKGVLYVNDTQVWSATGTFTAPCTLTLFALNRSGSVIEHSTTKLYYCQLYDNGTLVRDFVPCINDSGEVGLYDLVGRKFFGNAGTGEFIAGPEVQTVPKAPANFRVESETDTLVTLAWDASDKALGYRLYRQGHLLADTEETSVSVVVEPFSGAVFTLTAYNENGEGAETSLTHFSIPENP